MISLGNFGFDQWIFQFSEKTKTEINEKGSELNSWVVWLQITISIAAGWDLKLVRPVQMLIKERKLYW